MNGRTATGRDSKLIRVKMKEICHEEEGEGVIVNQVLLMISERHIDV